MTDGETSAKARKSAAAKRADLAPLPGLGGTETLPTGTALQEARDQIAQLNARVQSTDANMQKAIRVVGALKNKIGDVEARLIEAEMDRDDFKAQAQSYADQLQQAFAELDHLRKSAAPVTAEAKAA